MSNAGVFKGQCAIVTGGATGIGESTAKMLAADGAEVTIFDIDEAGCARVVKEIQAAGGRASARRVDLTDWNATRDAVTAVHDAAGRLDVIVHSAGGFPRYVNLLDCPVEDWDLVVNSNLRSMFYLLKVAGPLMMARRYGRFVTLSSMAARSGVNPNPPHYTAAKAGVLGLTRQAALDLGKHGQRGGAGQRAECSRQGHPQPGAHRAHRTHLAGRASRRARRDRLRRRVPVLARRGLRDGRHAGRERRGDDGAVKVVGPC
jgi:3-oxoacyl-[acyl-carrier protein] reductase